MKCFKEYLIERKIVSLVEFILENNYVYYDCDDFTLKVGNHFSIRTNRGKESNFNINLINTNKKSILNELLQFMPTVISKQNILTCGDDSNTLKLVGYKFSFIIFLESLNINNAKPIFVIKTFMLTDDEYGSYKDKYKQKSKNTIFISDIKR